MSIYSTVLDLFRAVSVDDGGTDEIRVNITSSALPSGGATAANQVPNISYVTGTVAVTTTQAEAKVGASSLANRSRLVIHNSGDAAIYVGPSGLTSSNGLPVAKNQTLFLEIGPSISVFILTASSTATAVVQEFS